MVTFDVALQVELVIRLIGSAILGAAIGLEREHHGHPAGTRTHLLVALGSAVFTELSIHGFPTGEGETVDPTRIAAQIVTGIGFLGAGAIIKYGTNIRGLTTAASLWCAAGVGMAAGAGAWIIAIAATLIVIVSLGPVRWMTERAGLGERGLRIRVRIATLEQLGEVTERLAKLDVAISDVSTERDGDAFQVGVRLGLPAGVRDRDVADALRSLEGLELIQSTEERD
jgi:putative Mg2+ transporter-C (MgtC) family protein